MSEPNPTMQALADAAAAQIARKHVEWIGDGTRIEGPIYRHIESVAAPAILAVLEQQRYAVEAKLRAKASPAERPADKIAAGLKDAISATRLANTIIALLPPDTATPVLQNQIICALAPHVSHTAADFQRGEAAE